MNTATPNLMFVSQSWAGGVPARGDNDGASSERMAAHAIELIDLERKLRETESEAQAAAALLDLSNKLESSRDLRHAASVLVNELQSYFGCQRVVLGLCPRRKRGCRLSAVSGSTDFDQQSDFNRELTAALDETVQRNARAAWPPLEDADRAGTLAHQKLFSRLNPDAPALYSLPLRNEHAEPVGVLLLLGLPPLAERLELLAVLRACEARLGSCLELLRRAERGPVVRWLGRMKQRAKSRPGLTAIAATVLTAAVLAVPMPYKVGCRCQIQPVKRRFVAAPFEGRLEKSLVKQGDVVQQGQELARMDGREIRWELAGLVAEHNRASKQRDAAIAKDKVADAQAAKFDMERLELKIQLLEHRVENLEIKSPIDGIVVNGDLEKAEGAPLAIGQTLFEVAPLDNMTVELAIAEEEISYVRAGGTVTVRLDSYPGQTWTGTIDKIHPRSELRDSKSVFIAEFESDNPDGQLRPGMNGDAKIAGPRRALAWNLFHRATESLAAALGW